MARPSVSMTTLSSFARWNNCLAPVAESASRHLPVRYELLCRIRRFMGELRASDRAPGLTRLRVSPSLSTVQHRSKELRDERVQISCSVQTVTRPQNINKLANNSSLYNHGDSLKAARTGSLETWLWRVDSQCAILLQFTADAPVAAR